jgi:aspartyl protease family protein
MNSDQDKPSPHKKSGKFMLYIAWIIALGLLTLFFRPIEERQFNPNTSPSSRSDGAIKEVQLSRNRYGHYITSGLINNKAVVFLVDTGASEVSIPQNVAQKLGLKPGMALPRGTANGTIEVYMTELDQLQIGDIELYDLRASINPHMDGETILLDMSALREIEFRQRGSVLTLTQFTQP